MILTISTNQWTYNHQLPYLYTILFNATILDIKREPIVEVSGLTVLDFTSECMDMPLSSITNTYNKVILIMVSMMQGFIFC